METNTINVTLFNQVATKRHLNLNQLLTNAFTVELKSYDTLIKLESSRPEIKTRKLLSKI